MKDDTKDMLISLGTVATIGALTGLGLSFTALSPLVMGGIVGSIIRVKLRKSGIRKKGNEKKLFYILSNKVINL